MRAGTLDHAIMIQKIAFGPDANGVMRETITNYIPMRAALIEPDTSTEIIRPTGPGAISERTVTFRMRFVDGLELRDRIACGSGVYAGVVFDIRSIKQIGRRRGLEVQAVARNGDDRGVTML